MSDTNPETLNSQDSNNTLVNGEILVPMALKRASESHKFGNVVNFMTPLPGRPDILLAVSNAAVNTWPMVMISGSCDQKYVGRGDFEELDQGAAVKPFSIFSAKANDIKEIPNCVFTVLHRATSGRPGWWYLNIPSDVLHQTVTKSEADKLLIDAENCRKQEVIETVGSFESERPLIVFGEGAGFTRAENELKKLVESTGIPFLPTPIRKDLLPDTHELAAAARSLAIGIPAPISIQTEPRARLHAGTWGTMGVRLGYCIAAAVALPGRLVLAVEGDSGFGFSAMEVECQGMVPLILEEIFVGFVVSVLLGGSLWIFKRFRACLATRTKSSTNDTGIQGVLTDADTTPSMAPGNPNVTIDMHNAGAEVPMAPGKPNVTIDMHNAGAGAEVPTNGVLTDAATTPSMAPGNFDIDNATAEVSTNGVLRIFQRFRAVLATLTNAITTPTTLENSNEASANNTGTGSPY